jgi:multicomponent Na+:H+ antiporter subunit D
MGRIEEEFSITDMKHFMEILRELLSLFTTRGGFFFLVMLLHTYGMHAETLAFFGSITAIYSIIFASLEQNVCRFLCYNTVEQLAILIIAGSLLGPSEKAVPILTQNIFFSLVYQSLLCPLFSFHKVERQRTINVDD